MYKISPYQNYAKQYDQWFDENRQVYEAELRAVRSFIPERLCGLEIGAGTGRFAAPLGIQIGIEPVESMRKIARQRGVDVLGGQG
ncbi:class I SAM-dependent methyltransferase [Desulfobacter postgatei]|uniref:class I SAM-dependent methyltransferase n=1 Tax=Desulfobacter postgatei TaxID=2293 RepID=UPI000232BAAF|nr:class I SAM-dependent methyltransferase [Desulfobacter postgatei]